MGSPLRLTTVGAGTDDAGAAWAAVVAEFEAAEQAMSRQRPTSDLEAVNERAGSGERIAVDRRLRAALVAARRAGGLTGGRFDARILADLERLRSSSPSTDAAARPDLRASAGSWLDVGRRVNRVAVSCPVDLDGIGKGLALRWAWRQARAILAPGVGALLEAGGDLVGSTPAPDPGTWRIGVEDPAAEPGEDPVAVIGLERGAITTSSAAVHRWRVGERVVHHLIDPATGEPGGDGLLAVTVGASDPAWAEVWSKALFVAGRSAIAATARGRGLAAWWVADDGSVEMTPAARRLTIWSRDDA